MERPQPCGLSLRIDPTTSAGRLSLFLYAVCNMAQNLLLALQLTAEFPKEWDFAYVGCQFRPERKSNEEFLSS